MATVAYEVLDNDVGVKVVKWVLTTANNDGQPYPFAGRYPYKSMHVVASAWGGATLKMQGSNEIAAAPSSWISLMDPQGNELVFTADKIEQILENTNQIRPVLTVVGAGASITILVCIAS
jgi:hypothetical protein